MMPTSQLTRRERHAVSFALGAILMGLVCGLVACVVR